MTQEQLELLFEYIDYRLRALSYDVKGQDDSYAMELAWAMKDQLFETITGEQD